jgi:hypothetical protein
MLDNPIEIGQLDAGGALLATDKIPVERGAGNAFVLGLAMNSWRPELVGLTGGGGTKLDGLVTVGLPLRTRVDLYADSQLQFWLLQEGTAAEDAGAGIVRPDDYATTTNERNWVRVL